MANSEAFDKLVFELGDKARDQLADRTPPLPAMGRVFDAEEALLARREELEGLEARLNEIDQLHREHLEQRQTQRDELEQVTKQFRKMIVAVEAKVKDIRKKLSTARAESRISRDALKVAEARVTDVTMSSPDPVRVEQAKLLLKRLRVGVLRKEREISELAAALTLALTPEPGQPGAEGLKAHRILLDMEDEDLQRTEEVDTQIAEIDTVVAQKEQEVQEAEAELSEALLLLGEECYAKRIPDPTLNPLYAKLDRLK